MNINELIFRVNNNVRLGEQTSTEDIKSLLDIAIEFEKISNCSKSKHETMRHLEGKIYCQDCNTNI